MNCSLTKDIIGAVMALGEWPQNAVPELKGASEWVTARPDGTLITESGFDPATGVYVRMDKKVQDGVGLVADQPTSQDVERARHIIIDDLLGDFEFETEADRANAVGILVTGAVRYAFTGVVPLVLLDATMAMSGKGTLASVIQKMAGVIEPDVRSFPEKDDELGKSIVSTLRSSANPVIVWDNVERTVEGDVLAGLLTSRVFKQRLLRANDDFVGINDRIWCATGNNIRLGKDIRRRSIRIRQAPKHDPREGKRKFQHPDLFKWMDQKRDALAWAVGVFVRAWACAGRPEFSNTVLREKLASYRSWVNVVGGILETVGITDFLENVTQLQYDDESTLERADFLEAVEALKGFARFTPQELAQAFNDASPEVQEALPPRLRGKGLLVNVTGSAMRSYLVSIREQMAGLPEDRHIAEAGTQGRTVCWKLSKSGPESAPVAQSAVSVAASSYLGYSM